MTLVILYNLKKKVFVHAKLLTELTVWKTEQLLFENWFTKLFCLTKFDRRVKSMIFHFFWTPSEDFVRSYHKDFLLKTSCIKVDKASLIIDFDTYWITCVTWEVVSKMRAIFSALFHFTIAYLSVENLFWNAEEGKKYFFFTLKNIYLPV